MVNDVIFLFFHILTDHVAELVPCRVQEQEMESLWKPEEIL